MEVVASRSMCLGMGYQWCRDCLVSSEITIPGVQLQLRRWAASSVPGGPAC